MSTYQTTEVGLALTYFFHNSEPWRRDDLPDELMPRSASNPATRNTEWAVRVDVERAWWYLIHRGWGKFREAGVLWLRYEKGWGINEIASYYGISRQHVNTQLSSGLEKVRHAANHGLRPSDLH